MLYSCFYCLQYGDVVDFICVTGLYKHMVMFLMPFCVGGLFLPAVQYVMLQYCAVGGHSARYSSSRYIYRLPTI